MSNTPEMRALSAEEIGAVAGGYGLNLSSSTNTITVTETSTGNTAATSTGSTSGYSPQPWHHGYLHL